MNKTIPMLLGFLLLILAIWLQVTSIEGVRSFIVRLDDLAYDWQLRTRIFTHSKLPTTPIVIVDVDDKSLEAIGRWPWPRDKIATLVDKLKEQGAVVVALDMMFAEKENNIADALTQRLSADKLLSPQINSVIEKVSPEFDNDAKLAKSLSAQDVVLGMTFLPRKGSLGLLPAPILELTSADEKSLAFIQAQGYISNIDSIQAAAKNAGFINVYPDPDGIIRRVPLLMRYENNLYGSLAFSAVKLFLLQNVQLIAGSYNNNPQIESVKLGNHIIPVDAFGQMLVPFRGRSFTFPYYSALDVLNNKTPPNVIAGKIVFLGTSATGLGDLRATSVQGVFPGVEIQATIADGILSDHFSYKPEWTVGAEIFITVVFGFLCAIVFPFFGPRTLGPLIIVIPLLLIIANNILWERTGLILFIFVTIILIIALGLLNMMYGYLFETRRREKLKEMFGQYVPEKHIDEMLVASGSYALYGEDRDMTVLFADIRNFTSISEPMTASELKDMLNEFFTPMTEIIFRYHGTIDKYIGDLIMAFWGAPLRDKKHAEHAISAALDMQKAVEKLKPLFVEKGWQEIEIGIGLNSGIMSVGDMGSKFRRNYTVLGDAVNLASRIEGLTKFYSAKILVSEATQRDQKKFLFRKLDRVLVKGKKKGVEIFEVISRMNEATTAMKEEVEISNQALNFYFQQQWQQAKELFAKLLEQNTNSRFYLLMMTRIEEFEKSPPPASWDGVYAHANK